MIDRSLPKCFCLTLSRCVFIPLKLIVRFLSPYILFGVLMYFSLPSHLKFASRNQDGSDLNTKLKASKSSRYIINAKSIAGFVSPVSCRSLNWVDFDNYNNY